MGRLGMPSMLTETLYLLEGQDDPRFRLLLLMPTVIASGGWEPGKVHLVRFLRLRARLRALFPVLEGVVDRALLVLLGRVSGFDEKKLDTIHCMYGYIRLVPGHPQRGSGRPKAKEMGDTPEFKEAHVPIDIGKDGGDEEDDDEALAREPTIYFPLPHITTHGRLCVPRFPGFGPALTQAVGLIDAFHRGA